MTSWTTPPPGPEPTPPVPHEPPRQYQPDQNQPDQPVAAHPAVDVSAQPLPRQADLLPEALRDEPVPAYWSRPPAPDSPRAERPRVPLRVDRVDTAPEPVRAPAPTGYEPAAAPPVEEPPVPPSAPSARPPLQHPHLPAGAHVGDRRGLTATGAVTVALALGFLGAVIDVSTGSGLRSTFAVLFVLGSALAALLAHREDLKATVVMPPLTYCLLALVGSAIGRSASSGSFLKTQAVELVSSLTTGAPVLYTATGSALVVALVRAFRSAQRPSGPAAAPAAARTAGSPPRR